jgi:hypothetical protein
MILAYLEKTLVSLFREIQKDENVTMDTESFRGYFRSELLASGLDVTEFDRMWTTAHIEADRLEKALEIERSTHMKLLKEYIRASQVETLEIGKNMKKLYQDMNSLEASHLPVAKFIANDAPDSSNRAYQKYRDFISSERDMPSISSDRGIEKQIASLEGQTRRLLAEGELSPVSSSIAPGYTPIYE